MSLIRSVCVVDGQGGGIGAAIIKRLKSLFEEKIEVVALGTNAIATAQMLKARANRGASGENAIVVTVPRMDIIIGSVGIVMADAMMGEVTPRIAAAIAAAPARKLLIPISQENVVIVGALSVPLPHIVDTLIDEHLAPLLD